MLRYFKKDGGELDTAKLPPVGARSLHYAQLGYERLLRYRAPGGGFTYWGRGEPDLALTAYALRFLHDASDCIAVDEDVMAETRAWLVGRQREDGSWRVRQWWDDKEDPRQTALTTAFIARVLAVTRGMEKPNAQTQSAQTQTTPTPASTQTQTAPAQSQSNTSTTKAAAAQKQNAPQRPPLERALRYLAARASEMDEPYLIASYALASADAGDGEAVERAAQKLLALAHEEGAGSYWALETNTPFYGWGRAGRIETTALAVKALDAYCAKRPAQCSVEEKRSRRSARAIL